LGSISKVAVVVRIASLYISVIAGTSDSNAFLISGIIFDVPLSQIILYIIAKVGENRLILQTFRVVSYELMVNSPPLNGLYIYFEWHLYFTSNGTYTLLRTAPILYFELLRKVPTAAASGSTYGGGLRKYLRLRPPEVSPSADSGHVGVSNLTG
jgi:hypothetical protein